MCDVESSSTDIRNIFCRYKDNQNRILLNACNNLRLCDGGYIVLRNKMISCRRISYYSTFILVIFTLIFASYGMWLLRRYNYSYTLGGCSEIFLWPFEECPIAY